MGDESVFKRALGDGGAEAEELEVVGVLGDLLHQLGL